MTRITRRAVLAGVGAALPVAAAAFDPLDADTTGPLVADDALLVDLWRRRARASGAWDVVAERSPLPSDPGYRRWEVEYDAAAEMLREIDEAIIAAPAFSPAGMVIKARIAAEPDMGDPELDLPQQALQSLLADLERLATEART